MESTTHPADLITPTDAAGILRTTPSTVRRFILGGKLAAWRIGSRWWLSRADVEAFVVRWASPDAPPVETLQERRNREAETDAILRAAKVRR